MSQTAKAMRERRCGDRLNDWQTYHALIAEHLQPEDVVALLNRYFTLMHEVIWKFEGTLDKYMGDAIMARVCQTASTRSRPFQPNEVATMPKVDIGKHVDTMFRAFSERTRLRILCLLVDRETCVGDLVEILQLPQPTVSRHLA